MPTPVDVASSKVRILEAPILAPGTCMLCGASRSDDRGYIDMGKDIQYVGVIYFCTFCMTELANAIGCLMPEQAAELENELDAARQRILEFETKDRALNGAIDTLRNTGLFSGIDLTVVNSRIPVSTEQDAQPSNSISARDEHSIISPIEESTELTTEQGSDVVPATGSDELEFKLKL